MAAKIIVARRRNYLKDKTRINTIQDAIPDFDTYETGVFGFANKYSATYKMTDVDFSSISEVDQEDFFMTYSDILNSFDSKASYKITLFNRNMSYKKTDFIQLSTDLNDGYDHLRYEYNQMRRKNQAASHGYIQEKYLTVTTIKGKYELAEQYFERMDTDMNRRLVRLGSGVSRFDLRGRMEILYDLYRCGTEKYYDPNIDRMLKKKRSYKDYICPSYLRFHNFDFDIGKKYGRVLFIKDWGRSLKVETIDQLMGLKTNMMISIDIIPLSPEDTRSFLYDSEDNAESNVYRWGQKRNKNNIFMEPPLTMKRDRNIVATLSEDINTRNQKMFLSNVTIVILAESEEKLEEYTESLIETGYECGCQIEPLGFQQRQGLSTVLPYGPRFIENLRDVTTENMAVMMPFNSVSLNHPTGIPYGVQEETRQELLIDRRLLMNGNEWVIGPSGVGKSFRVKLTTFLESLITNGDTIFVDPHGEYSSLTQALGGTVIHLGGKSGDTINALDMCQGYGDGADIKKKTELLVSLFHAILDNEFIKIYESIMVRCATKLLFNYENNNYSGYAPTLVDLYNEIIKQDEPEAKRLALLLEPYVTGSLGCFSGYTNVNMYSRITCFDLSSLDELLWDAGMTVVMDAIKNRLVINQNNNIPTFIKIDEVGRFLDDVYLARLFESFYSEVRKYGGYITGIVQNANKLLKNERAINMLSNSEIVVMLRQSSMDTMALKDVYGLSKTQIDRLLSAENGCGIIKVGSKMINFDGRIEEGYLYNLADTRPVHEYNT